MSREALQEAEYSYPYHHIPDLGPFSIARIHPWGHEYLSYIEEVLGELANRPFTSLVDIGCGDGRLIAEISRRFDARLVGTDFSEQALRFARAFAPSAVFMRDVPDELFDAFTLVEVLEHIPPDEANGFLETIAATLAPGGFGIVTVPSTNDPLIPKHYRHFSRKSLTEVLEPYFAIERMQYLNARTSGTRLIRSLFSNRFFILNFAPFRERLYRFYKSRYGKATDDTGIRLMAVVRSKN
jgi:SAM-dependent methyltransferase